MRALVMSGGGVKGAVQVGMLGSLLEQEAKDYDLLAGISVGAINAAYLAQADKGFTNLIKQHSALTEFWLKISGNKDIWKHWFLIHEIAGLIYKDSFYNSKPLHELLKKNIDDNKIHASKRMLRLGVTAYGSGDYSVVDETENNIWEWVAASSAFPGFFLPIRRNNEIWVDGGARVVTPIKAAIEAGADKIDVLLASPLTFVKKDIQDNKLGTKISGLRVALRAIEMATHELFVRDIKMVEAVNELVKNGAAPGKRAIDLRVFHPDKEIVDFALEFDPKKIREMIEMGRQVIKS